MVNRPYILLDDLATQRQRYYTDPVEIITARSQAEIGPAFARLRDYHEQGLYLAGYMSYDLGLAIEPKLQPLAPKQPEIPFLQFGVFRSVSDDAPVECLYSATRPEITLVPQWSEAEYLGRFDRVLDYIKAGDVYQVNLTFPLSGPFAGDAASLFAAYRQRQAGRYGGIISLGDSELISLSPELFFWKAGENMHMRPMKGTRPRSTDPIKDEAIRQDMRGEEKSQAENLMIVDLLRNDLSRVSIPGTVRVPELFALETYPTLHQMTSRVFSKLKPGTGFETIIRNLFPCGSVTGAPKIRAMEIIHELEQDHRGAYCGSVGYIDPNGDACFDVSIRTLTLRDGNLRYNVGSGIVLDSDGPDEYRECLLKAAVLGERKVDIIETMRWVPGYSFTRKDLHMQRLRKSASELGYPLDEDGLARALSDAVAGKAVTQHVRLSLDHNGTVTVTTKPYIHRDRMNIALSKYPLSPGVQETAHKVSRRQFYDGERERLKAIWIDDGRPMDEVIFLDKNGLLCEGSFTSLFVQIRGLIYTPRLNNILPGVLRQDWIERGKAFERDLTIDDLKIAEQILVGNSLREAIPATVLSYNCL